MIAEPYICVENGPCLGNIYWFFLTKEGLISYNPDVPEATIERQGAWKPYADFEREKLRQIAINRTFISYPDIDHGYHLLGYYADDLIGYTEKDFYYDSESSRLLKRAEFLKAVCEKEGVEWFPKKKCDCECHHGGTPREMPCCECANMPRDTKKKCAVCGEILTPTHSHGEKRKSDLFGDDIGAKEKQEMRVKCLEEDAKKTVDAIFVKIGEELEILRKSFFGL